MTREWHTLIGLLIAGAMLTGCATIVNGKQQDFQVRSEPSGSQVFVDGEFRGRTPMITSLSRARAHLLRVEREGSTPYETSVTPQFAPLILGNLLFGGIVGIVVDLVTKSSYEFWPEYLHVVFPPLPGEGPIAKRFECTDDTEPYCGGVPRQDGITDAERARFENRVRGLEY